MKPILQHLLLSGVLLLGTSAAAPTSVPYGNDKAALQPLMVQTDKVLLREDFETAGPVDTKRWEPGQETRWKIENGMLTGVPAAPEFQKSKTDHNGAMARIALRSLPQNVAVAFSFRVRDAEQNKRGGFFELGHHIGRIIYDTTGVHIVVSEDARRLASAPFKIEPGKWYSVLAEIQGDELVVQFKDGPTLYAKDAFLATKKNGFQIAGFAQATVDVDNVTAWEVKPEAQPGWGAARSKFPPMPATQPAAKPAKPSKNAKPTNAAKGCN